MRLKQILRRLLMKTGAVEKHSGELSYWREQIECYQRWYEGRDSHLGLPAPTEEQKVRGYEPAENAIRTWARIHGFKYPEALKAPTDFFAGKTLLDVGCGPIPYALAFTDCEVWGLDQLIDGYRALGYPLDRYDARLHYVTGSAESMPFADDHFDAVIVVNALDHVDNFPAAAAEIRRVLRPSGVLRMQVHYHRPTLTEPWALNDDLLLANFAPLKLQKLATEPHRRHPQEPLVTWGTE